MRCFHASIFRRPDFPLLLQAAMGRFDVAFAIRAAIRRAPMGDAQSI
jgi:hypothetical protein